jgi:hypothetical protein
MRRSPNYISLRNPFVSSSPISSAGGGQEVVNLTQPPVCIYGWHDWMRHSWIETDIDFHASGVVGDLYLVYIFQPDASEVLSVDYGGWGWNLLATSGSIGGPLHSLYGILFANESDVYPFMRWEGSAPDSAVALLAIVRGCNITNISQLVVNSELHSSGGPVSINTNSTFNNGGVIAITAGRRELGESITVSSDNGFVVDGSGGMLYYTTPDEVYQHNTFIALAHRVDEIAPGSIAGPTYSGMSDGPWGGVSIALPGNNNIPTGANAELLIDGDRWGSASVVPVDLGNGFERIGPDSTILGYADLRGFYGDKGGNFPRSDYVYTTSRMDSIGVTRWQFPIDFSFTEAYGLGFEFEKIPATEELSLQCVSGGWFRISYGIGASSGGTTRDSAAVGLLSCKVGNEVVWQETVLSVASSVAATGSGLMNTIRYIPTGSVLSTATTRIQTLGSQSFGSRLDDYIQIRRMSTPGFWSQ